MSTKTTRTGSEAVAILEAVWQAATIRVPDLPQNVTLTVNRDGGRVLGYYAPSAWSSTTSPIHEVAVTASTIARGTRSLLTTVLHEAVHALAKARGVKDTSRQGRWHNLRFVTLAEEFGLVYPHYYPDDDTVGPRQRGTLRPDDRIGYSSVVLPDSELVRYAGVIDLIDRDFPFDLGYGERTPSKPRAVQHCYVVVPRADLSYTAHDVIQLAPSRYERIAPYLTEHRTITTTATQEYVIADLLAEGVDIHLSTEEYPR